MKIIFCVLFYYPINRWLLEQPNIPSVIIGVKTLAQLEDNLGAVGWSLSPEQVRVNTLL